MWLAGGLIALLTAFTVAELSAAIPRAGGMFDFIQRAFGKRIGLGAALAMLFSAITTVSLLSFVTGEFLLRLGIGIGSLSAVELGIVVIGLFTLINLTGTRVSGASQILFSSLKGAALIGLAIALFGGSTGELVAAETSDAALLRDGWLPIGTAVLVIISTYNGWWDVAHYSEEIEDPGRQIPRAMLGGIIGLTVLYLLINIAMFQVLTPDEMAGSSFVAADAAGAVFGKNADYLLTVFGVLSVGAIANLSIMTTTRLVYVLARSNVLSSKMCIVAKNGTPIWALLFVAATAAAFVLTGSYTALSSMTVSMGQATLVLTLLSAMTLRRKEPDLHRPFRIPLYPWTSILALMISAALLLVFVVQDPLWSLSGFALVAAIWMLIEYNSARRNGLVMSDIPKVE
jgi:basic amino acid/polyamine antiporter, APA family